MAGGPRKASFLTILWPIKVQLPRAGAAMPIARKVVAVMALGTSRKAVLLSAMGIIINAVVRAL